MDLRYALEEIFRNGRDPAWWRRRFLTHVVGRYFDRVDAGGQSILEREWDNLILLDACRYDLFAETAELPGVLMKRRSVASATPGFIRETFEGGTFHDIVYVTSNPYVDILLPDGTFHAVDHVWRDGWDEELATVHPDTMADRARAAQDRYPDKRILVHYLQPHYPFVGEIRVSEGNTFGVRDEALTGRTLGAEDRKPTPFERLQAGELSREEVWRAYRSNLEYALPSVEALMTDLPGLNVITSDHGNALGERAWPFPVRVYGHPLGIYTPALTEVPWQEYRNGERKAATAAPPVESDVRPEADVEERLRSLGYAE